MGKKHKKRKKGKSGAVDGAETTAEWGDVEGRHHLWHSVEPVWRWANNPIVADVLAAALVAGANAISKTRPARQAARSATSGAEAAAETASDSVGGLRHALLVAVGEIASRIVDAYEQEVAGKSGPGSERPSSRKPR